MHKRAVGVALRVRLAHAISARTISTFLEPQIRQLRPFDLPPETQFQPTPPKQRNEDPESLNYYETRQLRYAVPRKQLKKTSYASIVKALYSKETDMNDIYMRYKQLPIPRPLFLPHAELEQLLDLLRSPALRDKYTIKRLLTISEDMRACGIPLSIKEVNTLVFLILKDKNFQTQFNPANPPRATSEHMESMIRLLAGTVKWPVSTYNIALEVCREDESAFQEMLDMMKEKKVKWDDTTVRTVFRQRLRANEDPLETFYNLYSANDIGPQDINILLWGLLRSEEREYEKAVSVVRHLAQFSTNDIDNAARLNRRTFRAVKFEMKMARKKNMCGAAHREKFSMTIISDIPPTTITPGSFSMLIKHRKSFSECFDLLKLAHRYFDEIPTECLIDMYSGFKKTKKHDGWSSNDLFYLTEYVLDTISDHSVFTVDLFKSALEAYKEAGVMDPRGGTALVTEANCLEAFRLAKTDGERQAYLCIYFRRLHANKLGGQGGGEATVKAQPGILTEWMDVFLNQMQHSKELAAGYPKEEDVYIGQEDGDIVEEKIPTGVQPSTDESLERRQAVGEDSYIGSETLEEKKEECKKKGGEKDPKR
ncbi:hypothetical protein CJU90_2603 [Yarrowia sp. C11]|nr:hypothetical protein CKK34_4051 [Yarrowia sp. E02]KAG5369156.1 hypothetical protein CJU90_2603 [Yarrowia sp. C11]